MLFARQQSISISIYIRILIWYILVTIERRLPSTLSVLWGKSRTEAFILVILDPG